MMHKQLSFQRAPHVNQSQIDIDITSYVEKKISAIFHVVSTYFFRCSFDGQKIHVISTYFIRRNIKLVSEKSTLFGCAFNIISMGKKSTLFRCTFFEVFLIDERSKSFKCTYFTVILTDWKLTRLWHAYDVFLQDKNWWSFSYLFLERFWFIKTEISMSLFDVVSFWCSFSS